MTTDTKAAYPPGPDAGFMGLDYAKKFKEDPLGTALDQKQYGDIVYIRMGPYHWYLLNHPDYVKDVFVTRSKLFGKTVIFKRVLGSVDGNGLVLSEGDYWLKQRRVIQPAFNHSLLGKYAETMLDETKRIIERWQPGKAVNLADEMTDLTLNVAASVFLGCNVRDQAKELADAVTTISQILYREFTDVIPLPEWLPVPGKKEKHNAVAVIDRMIHKAIKEHKQNPGARTDVLSMLLSAVDTEGDGSKMTDKEVRDEAITMFNAGHDSTAAGLSWTWYLLMKNDSIYKELLATIDEVTKGELPTLQTLQEIPLCGWIVKEALRLYPPAWGIPRQALADVELGGYKLEKGSLLNLFPYIMQRDERFFKDPEKFDPARFSPEREHEHPSFAYFPFGAGPRSCIGREFALMEMQLVLIAICQKVRMELAPGQTEIVPNPLISLEPKGGVRAIPTLRS